MYSKPASGKMLQIYIYLRKVRYNIAMDKFAQYCRPKHGFSLFKHNYGI